MYFFTELTLPPPLIFSFFNSFFRDFSVIFCVKESTSLSRWKGKLMLRLTYTHAEPDSPREWKYSDIRVWEDYPRLREASTRLEISHRQLPHRKIYKPTFSYIFMFTLRHKKSFEQIVFNTCIYMKPWTPHN